MAADQRSGWYDAIASAKADCQRPVRLGAEQVAAEVSKLLALQNADGGWSQTVEMPSDAYATGQTLYSLSLAGVDRTRPEVQRANSFLVGTQRQDGSWPMTHRETPERKASSNTIPIVYFGSAWGTLGLIRMGP